MENKNNNINNLFLTLPTYIKGADIYFSFFLYSLIV